MPTPTKGPRLGGSPAHQRLILANLAQSLFEHGRITTTEAKARRLRPMAERLISKAKRGDLHARRQVLSVIRDKGVVHTLFEEIGPRFAERPGGYTRITKLGPRKGDNAPMAVIELVGALAATPAASRTAPAPGRAAAPAPAAPGATAASAAASVSAPAEGTADDTDDGTDDGTRPADEAADVDESPSTDAVTESADDAAAGEAGRGDAPAVDASFEDAAASAPEARAAEQRPAGDPATADAATGDSAAEPTDSAAEEQTDGAAEEDESPPAS